MIAVVTCTCGGAENMARSILKNGGHKDWLNLSIAKGAKQTEFVLSTLKSKYEDNSSYKALRDYVTGRGKYIVIIGYKDGTFAWSDVARGSIRERLDAEILVKEFA